MPDRRKIATLRTGSRATGLPAARLSPLSGDAFQQPLPLALKLKPCVLMCLATGPAPLFSVAAGRGLVEVWIIDTHPIGLAVPIGQSPRRTRKRPARMSGAFARWPGSVAVGLAAAGPDEGVGLGAIVVEEVGVDWSVEARIVQLDREIIAALAGALRPGGADFGIMWCTT